MSNDTKWRAHMRALCAELGPDDGLTSHEIAKRDRKSRTTHTHRRLGGQIKRALELALGAASDVSLHGVWIVRCEPDPDASRFRVVIRPEDEDDTVLDRLEAARSWLRMEVAHAIHRKRVPDLRFVRAPEEST